MQDRLGAHNVFGADPGVLLHLDSATAAATLAATLRALAERLADGAGLHVACPDPLRIFVASAVGGLPERALAAAALAESAGIDRAAEELRRPRSGSSMIQGVILDCCRRAGIPAQEFGPFPRMLRIGEGRHRQLVQLTDTDRTTLFGTRLAKDKIATNRVLAQAGLPVARQVIVTGTAEEWDGLADLGRPLVVKPAAGNRSRGVNVAVADRATFRQAVRDARVFGKTVIAESFLPGHEFRIFVARDRVLIGFERTCPQVVGDGVSTLRQLIDAANDWNAGWPGLLFPLDEDAALIAEQGLGPESVPDAGRQVLTGRIPGPLHGGRPVFRAPETMHPDNLQMFVQAARLLGLDQAGLDFRTPDLAQSWREVPCGLCEVNTGAALFPLVLWDRDFFARLFLGEDFGRLAAGIPRAVILLPGEGSGGLGPDDVGLASLSAAMGGPVAFFRPGALWFDDLRSKADPATPEEASRIAADHPLCAAAVFALPVARWLREGLGLDRAGAVIRLGAAADWSAQEAAAADRLAASLGVTVQACETHDALRTVLARVLGSG
ncbi:MAG TPA: hypothetical protein VLA78_14965 [Paracoccaceae bacterium]|nr:hypothetical protein [Paracoccaceae bacterium]